VTRKLPAGGQAVLAGLIFEQLLADLARPVTLASGHGSGEQKPHRPDRARRLELEDGSVRPGAECEPRLDVRQDFFEFVTTRKLVLASNHKPRVRGTDHAVWRRLALVPFGVKFWNADEPEPPDEERDETLRADKGLRDKLLVEREGILRWLVAGCLEWQADGLKRPKAVRERAASTAGTRT
jgi:hypothetical protein